MDAAQRPPAALFVDVGVGLVAQDHLVAAAAVRQQADQVAHGAGGDEQGRLFAQPVGGQRLQPLDGRVVAENVVAHLGPAIAGRMAGVGWVKVSLRRSMRGVEVMREAPQRVGGGGGRRNAGPMVPVSGPGKKSRRRVCHTWGWEMDVFASKGQARAKEGLLPDTDIAQPGSFTIKGKQGKQGKERISVPSFPFLPSFPGLLNSDLSSYHGLIFRTIAL